MGRSLSHDSTNSQKTNVKTNSKCPAGQGAKPSPSVVGQEAKASPNIVGQGAKASPRVVGPFSGDAPHCPAQDSSCLRTSQQIAAEGPRDADGSSELEQCPSRGTYWDIRFQPRWSNRNENYLLKR